MSQISENNEGADKSNNETSLKRCFVIMPISDPPEYATGHFTRVYKDLIEPAILSAGFIPERSGDKLHTKVIMLEILKSITEFDMAICDLSSLNPNVMYELGIRQMAKMPVTLIKDERTRRIFDTGLMSDIEYDSSLRFDLVMSSRSTISESIKATYQERESPNNSLLDLLGTKLKIQEKTVEVSQTDNLILTQLKNITNILSDNNNVGNYGNRRVSNKAYYPQMADGYGKNILVGSIIRAGDKSNNSSFEANTFYFVEDITPGSANGVGYVTLNVTNLRSKKNEHHVIDRFPIPYLVVASVEA